MATWDLVGYAVFRQGSMTDHHTGEAEFTSDTKIYVPVYEVPDSYVTVPSSADPDEVTAIWPSVEGVDIDQTIVSMTSADDVGGAGHRIYLWGDGEGTISLKGDDSYHMGGMIFLPGEFILGRGAGGAGFIPFKYWYGQGDLFTANELDAGAIPRDVYMVSEPGGEAAYNKKEFLAGLTMGLCGKGGSDLAAGGDDFGRGHALGCGLREGR